MASSSIRSRDILFGAFTVIALGIAVAIFGFPIVGKFCLFMVPVNIMVSAVRAGRFPFTFGRHGLVRASDPRGFWIAMSICGLIAAINL
ncbi:MAG: hypothetical protein C0520_10340, partial [Sphingopyxis sp.]|nr:hypothetical protein [Sphingopyxis sp.]